MNYRELLFSWPLRDRWDSAFLKYIGDLDKKKPVIWCGDLNVAHLWIDLANPKPNCNKTAGFLYGERDNFTRVLGSGFVDVFRHYHPKAKKAYTFWSYLGGARAKNVGWRLDYFVVSERILSSVSKIWKRTFVTGSE